MKNAKKVALACLCVFLSFGTFVNVVYGVGDPSAGSIVADPIIDYQTPSNSRPTRAGNFDEITIIIRSPNADADVKYFFTTNGKDPNPNAIVQNNPDLKLSRFATKLKKPFTGKLLPLPYTYEYTQPFRLFYYPATAIGTKTDGSNVYPNSYYIIKAIAKGKNGSLSNVVTRIFDPAIHY